MNAMIGQFLSVVPLLVAFAIARPAPLYAAEPVTEKAPTFQSPEAAFKAMTDAFIAKNYKAAWNCLTPKNQDYQAVEARFVLVMEGKGDGGRKFMKAQVATPKEPPTDEEGRQALMASTIADKFGIFAEHQKFEEKAEHPVDWKEPLRNVVIDQDRACGVVRRYDVSYHKKRGQPEVIEKEFYDEKIYFQKSARGRLIALPTKAEAKRDADVEGAKFRGEAR